MDCQSVSQFLDALRGNRLLSHRQLAELTQLPEASGENLDALTGVLEQRGWLTRYQINLIREGNGHRLVFAEYRILDKLGESASGPVFRASHPSFPGHSAPVSSSRRSVVLKLIHPEWLQPADTVTDFLRRAHAASLLAHPHLVNVLDVGQFSDQPFVVIELVNGVDLNWLVRTSGPLSVELACTFVRQAALGLQHAHEKHVFHGDIRPGTLILTPVTVETPRNGEQIPVYKPTPKSMVKIMDIGLVPRGIALGSASQPDPSAKARGPVEFLAPERIYQAHADAVSDLYGLGAVLYYLLTGRPPIEAQSEVEALLQIQQGQPAPLTSIRPEVPPAVVSLVESLLAKEPHQRPAHAASVAQSLNEFAVAEAPPPSAMETRIGSDSAIPIASPSSATIQMSSGSSNDIPLASETNTALRGPDDEGHAPLAAETMTPIQEDPPIAAPLADPIAEDPDAPPAPTAAWVYTGTEPPASEPEPNPFTTDENAFTPPDAGPVEDDPFAMSSLAQPASPTAAPVRRRLKKEGQKNATLWIVLGAALHLTAITVLILFLMGVFDSAPSEQPRERPKSTEPNSRFPEHAPRSQHTELHFALSEQVGSGFE